MSTQRKPTLPTKGLLQGGRYVPAIQHTDRSNNELWAKFKAMLPTKEQTCATSGKRS